VTDADLRRFALFAELDDAELQLLAFLLEERQLDAEQPVWREGDAADALWLLERGALRFESRGEGALGQLEAPASVGAASLVGDFVREASAFAAGGAQALVLSRTAFAQLLEAAPQTAALVASAIAGELGAVLRDGIAFMNARR
jgi:CRP/FNR family transcriptional regulator, cyclic AMP receptor protein